MNEMLTLPRLFPVGDEYLPVKSCLIDVPVGGDRSSYVADFVAPPVPAAVSLAKSHVSVLPLAVQNEGNEEKVPAEAVSVTMTELTLLPPMFVTVNRHPVLLPGFTVPG
ncbi:MAG TPA: hypothetical protein VHI53_05900 [Gaiellaceae bacterium]|nr:hypothetical protein [Gaiellaceae bacterium]